MEFMNNGDLAKLIKSHILINKPIEEERLWNIFIQALKSLEYIHSKQIIHRDIKPENLFMNNNGVVKLGDFGFSANYKNNNNNNMNISSENMQQQNNQNDLAKIDCKGTFIGTENFMSPEMVNNCQYDLKTDVYSMGCTFFQAMFWNTPKIQNNNFNQMFYGNNMNNMNINSSNDQIIYNKDYYSKELINLVYKMIEINQNQRPDSKNILNSFIKEYIKKYSKNSSIDSVLSCLYSCFDLVDYFKNQNMGFRNFLINKNISFEFLSGLNSINNPENWKSFLFKMRLIISKQNNTYEKDIEIDPRFFLSYLLKRLHHELNNKNDLFSNPFSTLFTGKQSNINNNNNIQNNLNSNSTDFSNKEDSFKFFCKYFKENNNSIISNLFYGNMKTKTLCESCQLKTYSFNFFNFITFNLDSIQKYIFSHNYQVQTNQLSIADCFTIQNSILVKINNYSKICRNCKKKRHFERKQFCTFPKYLIVCFDRGINCQNKLSVKYQATLDLKKNCENVESYNYFRLIGIVKRLDINNIEHYISLYFDCEINSWILKDDSCFRQINSPLEHTQGNEIMLFYEGIIKYNNNNGNINTLARLSMDESKNTNSMLQVKNINNNNNNINNNVYNMNITNNMNNLANNVRRSNSDNIMNNNYMNNLSNDKNINNMNYISNKNVNKYMMNNNINQNNTSRNNANSYLNNNKIQKNYTYNYNNYNMNGNNNFNNMNYTINQNNNNNINQNNIYMNKNNINNSNNDMEITSKLNNNKMNISGNNINNNNSINAPNINTINLNMNIYNNYNNSAPKGVVNNNYMKTEYN